jgi:hypothetical protein
MIMKTGSLTSKYNIRHWIFCGSLLTLILLVLMGCGSRKASQSFMREDVNISFMRTIAVLPLEDLGGGTGAAQRTRDIMITQVLSSGLFDVADRGRVDSAFRAEAMDPLAPLDNITMKRLGQRIGVEGFIMGSVEQISDSRTGGAVYPEISLTLRLVEVESGKVVWQASDRGSGYSLADRLFGIRSKNSFQITLELVDRLLATIR